ncbi:MAG: hypothetical protein ND895_02555 [Pyrinomonadaceae bacterium]|nr:hypothetical protein [Pyrinomonadaceae bacterium]
MRIVDAALKPFRRTRTNDPVFGPMLYMGDQLGYWEGKVVFAPTSDVVEVFVDGNARDDLRQQQLFFERVVQEWPSLRAEISRILATKWQELMPERVNESSDHFIVSSMSIPNGSIEDGEWEISLSSTSEQNQLLTVRMKGRKPQEVVLDD